MTIPINISGGVPSDSIRNEEINSNANIDVSKLKQRVLQEYPVNLRSFQIHDSASGAVLPNPSANDDLGYYPGTFGTGSPSIQTYDVKTVGATTLYARETHPLPAEYDPGETVKIRVHLEMSALADVTCTVDVQAYLSDENAGIGSDLVTTSATDCNSVSDVDYDFELDPDTLNPGDEIDFRIAIAVNDASGGSPVIATIGKVSILCDTRG